MNTDFSQSICPGWDPKLKKLILVKLHHKVSAAYSRWWFDILIMLDWIDLPCHKEAFALPCTLLHCLHAQEWNSEHTNLGGEMEDEFNNELPGGAWFVAQGLDIVFLIAMLRLLPMLLPLWTMQWIGSWWTFATLVLILIGCCVVFKTIEKVVRKKELK